MEYKSNMKVLAKIAKAKKEIRGTKIRKLGHNNYSDYDYFTPEQVYDLVETACENNGLVTFFGTLQDDNGQLSAYLDVVDEKTGESIRYHQVTAIPSITATNIAQQLGGMNTYSDRYLRMFAFGIVDNNLDFDAKDNRGQNKKAANVKKSAQRKANEKNRSEKVATEEPAATTKTKKPALVVLKADNEKWGDIIKYLKQEGTSIDDLLVRYRISNAVRAKLEKEVGEKS